MSIVELIKNLGAVNIVMILGIIVIIILLFMNYCRVNELEERDNSVKSESKQIEKLDESIKQDEVKPVTRVALYYTEWCGYSKMFMPVWTSIKEKIGNSNIKNSVIFEQYDCDKNSNICDKNKINGFPSIILYTASGESIDYTGNRDVDSMVNFITQYI